MRIRLDDSCIPSCYKLPQLLPRVVFAGTQQLKSYRYLKQLEEHYIGLGGPTDALRIGPEVLCENKLAYSSQLSLLVGEEEYGFL